MDHAGVGWGGHVGVGWGGSCSGKMGHVGVGYVEVGWVLPFSNLHSTFYA